MDTATMLEFRRNSGAIIRQVQSGKTILLTYWALGFPAFQAWNSFIPSSLRG